MVCCFGFVADSSGSMVLVVVLAVCFFFFLGLWQTHRVCGGLLFKVIGVDFVCLGWWCG